MKINELYAEYRRTREEKLLIELFAQSERYCMHIYWKRRRTFGAIPKETALDVAQEQIVFCCKRCLVEEEVECFRRCIGAKFRYKMLDCLEELIKAPKLVYMHELRDKLGLKDGSLTDDEVMTHIGIEGMDERESEEQEKRERWDAIMRYEGLTDLEKEVFWLSFLFSADLVAEKTGLPKQKVIRIKSKAKAKLMKGYGGGEK